MTPKRWKKISGILANALQKPVSERDSYLNNACGTDAELRGEVESLLAFENDKQAESFEEKISDFIFEHKNSLASDAFVGRQIGNYRIKQEIGAGGMGVVFLAERTDGEFEQQVALKIIRQTFTNSQLENRFRRERQILASLNHPNIAKLLDGGVSDFGEPFLVMEYIKGEPLLEFAEKKN